jgi:hypothetical protein
MKTSGVKWPRHTIKKGFILDVTADHILTRLINCIMVKREEVHVRFDSTKEYRAMFRGQVCVMWEAKYRDGTP